MQSAEFRICNTQFTVGTVVPDGQNKKRNAEDSVPYGVLLKKQKTGNYRPSVFFVFGKKSTSPDRGGFLKKLPFFRYATKSCRPRCL